MFVRTSMDSESRDSTKITSPLADSRIFFFIHEDDFLQVHCQSIHFSQCLTFDVDVKTCWSLQNQSLDDKFCGTSWAHWNHFYESLAFSRHSVDLKFNKEVMKPERFTEAPDHAGFNPDAMRASKWQQKTTLEGDVSHFSSFSRTSDTCWNEFDVRMRPYWRWWRKSRDEDRWYASSIARTNF